MSHHDPMPRRLKALLYGDVDLNVIDGSAIWVASMAEVLASAGCHVTLMLKHPIRITLVMEPVADHPAIRIVPPTRSRSDRQGSAGSLSPDRLLASLRRLDSKERFDLIVVRGVEIARRMAGEASLRGRLWTYLTDVPQSAASMDAKRNLGLEAIVEASRVMICQTEDLRTFLEHMVPSAAGRTMVLPPAIPRLTVQDAPTPLGARPIRLAYVGKFAPGWNTLEMTELPGRLADRGITAELHAVGDKIHWESADPSYQGRMEDALTSTPGVIWHRGQTRQGALAIAAASDIGLGWRDRVLDASLELSTKILEYGSVGLPAILNRTPMHERLLGADYPLFASDMDDVVDAICAAVADPSVLADASERCRALAEDHLVEKASARLRRSLDRAFPAPLRANRATKPLRIGVASHDFKFFTRVLDHLRALPDVEVRVDAWSEPRGQNLARSVALRDWADVVICEWCGPNAVWYSRHRRPGQRLIVRLHRYELDRRWPAAVEIESVDQVVCVSQSYAAYTRATTGWPASKIVVIPNWVDDAALDRPKFAGSEYNLGFIGMAPARKRLDRALDIVESLRRRDPRFGLFVKTKMTWDYPGIWQGPDEREHVDSVMKRIQTTDLLRQHVVFDDFGADVGSWLRRIGFVLSTSDDESFHLAPAEGMASGAVPMILDWPGADTIYDQRWIHRSIDALVEDIDSLVHDGRWEETRRLAQRQVRDAFSLDLVCAAWDELLATGAVRSSRLVVEAEPAGRPT